MTRGGWLSLGILKTGKIINELNQKQFQCFEESLNESFPGLRICIISINTTYNDILIKHSTEPDYRREKRKTHVKKHNPFLQHDAKMQKHMNPSCCMVTVEKTAKP